MGSTLPQFDEVALSQIEVVRRNGSGVIIIVTPSVWTNAITSVATTLGISTINIGAELSQRLLDIPFARRARKAPQILTEILDEHQGDVAVSRLGILHLPALQVDVVRALEFNARQRVIIAEWIGGYDEGHLVHAAPGHAEYRRWDASGLTVIQMMRP